MANEPQSPLPLAHLAANNAALLVFDEWNEFFPSPVGYSMNGEQQVYWDVGYTYDKFQDEGKFYRFLNHLQSVAKSYTFLGSASFNILHDNNTRRPLFCSGFPNEFYLF